MDVSLSWDGDKGGLMFALTIDQANSLVPHTFEEIGEDRAGGLILKCQECDRVVRYEPGKMPVTVIEGEQITIIAGGKELTTNYPHSFSKGGISIGRVTVTQ